MRAAGLLIDVSSAAGALSVSYTAAGGAPAVAITPSPASLDRRTDRRGRTGTGCGGHLAGARCLAPGAVLLLSVRNIAWIVAFAALVVALWQRPVELART